MHINSQGNQDPLFPLSQSIYFFGDSQKVIRGPPHPITNFGTLSTSIPRETETPISIIMVHIFLCEPPGRNWRLFLTLEQTLEHQLHPQENLVHPIIGLSGPLIPFPQSICSIRDLREVIRGCSTPQNKLWNPRYILRKIWYIQSLSYRTLISLLVVHLIIRGPLGSDWRLFPTPKRTLESQVHL